MCASFFCFLLFFFRTCAATPAPVDKLERNGKEVEKEEDKVEGEVPSDKEKVREKEKDEGKEGDSNRTADPEEVGQNSRHLIAKTSTIVCS